MSSTSLAAAKAHLRSRIRASIRALSPAVVTEQSEAVAARFASLPFLARSSGVGVFLSMRSKKTGLVRGEIDSGPIFSGLFSPGDRRKQSVFIPKVTDFLDGGMEMLRVSAGAREVAAYPLNRWNIPEPTDKQAHTMVNAMAKHQDMDVLIVPGVAFDNKLRRCGQGGGFYDRYITRLQSLRAQRLQPPTILVGIGLTEQFVDVVPTSTLDHSLDYVVLPHTIIIKKK